jgi:hypothetical protein
MNYYIDEEALQIEEKNIFTAIELITLLPVSGAEVMDRFFKSNNWACGYFHQYDKRMVISPSSAGKNRLKKTVEWIFQNPLGDWLDNYFMMLTSRRWKQKEEKRVLNIKGNRMGLHTGKHFSKPNPVFFQEKVLALYHNNLSEMERYWDETSVQLNRAFFFKEMM